MPFPKSIKTEHKDLIHDVVYDFYGTRMATCSSDQCVKIWDLVNGTWTCTSSWKTHSGSIWRVSWAHPEFGQVIATGSFDRTAVIWEELPGETLRTGQSTWVRRSSLVDSRTAVTDVQFSPKHLGLQLAVSSSDGTLRVYEAPDVMNLGQWTLQHTIASKLSCSSISWNPSIVHAPMIAVGSDDPSTSAGGKVQIYELNSSQRKWVKVESIMTVTDQVRDVSFAPNHGRSYHTLAIASKDVRIVSLKPLRKDQSSTNHQGGTKFEMTQVAQFDDHISQVWRVSWNVTGTVLASTGDDGCVRLWKANYLDTWKCISTLKGDGSTVKTDSSLNLGQPGMSTSYGSSNSGTSVGSTISMNANSLHGRTFNRSRRVSWIS